ncbi:hypothetical protein [Methylibium petroleiphilum]
MDNPQHTLMPLNGTKTHPLSEHALEELRHIAMGALPRSSINPGVVNRLLREALVESFEATSPYPSHRGKSIEHLRITDAGLAAATGSTHE